jgi:hypothetical protein
MATLTCVPPTSHTIDRYAVKEVSASPAFSLFPRFYLSSPYASLTLNNRLSVRSAARGSQHPTFAPHAASNSVRKHFNCRPVDFFILKIMQGNTFALFAIFGMIGWKGIITTVTAAACAGLGVERSTLRAVYLAPLRYPHTVALTSSRTQICSLRRLRALYQPPIARRWNTRAQAWQVGMLDLGV